MRLPIYLDYAATTPVDPRVATKLANYLTQEGCFGNPASLSHVFGRAAKLAVDGAREQVADLLGAEPSEIVWTSGATEANNLALKGAAELYQRRGRHVITMKTEHKSVLDTCQQLEKNGYDVTYLTPETNGLLDIEKLKKALRDDTVLVSVMHVNNETGVIQDIEAIAAMTTTRGILFHVDAAQSAGKLPLDMRRLPIDLLSCCAHKVYGPKGVGALYVRRRPRVKVAAQIHGGGQEQGMRSGTLATHQIVAMGEAMAIAQEQMMADYAKVAELRQRLWSQLSNINGVDINGEAAYPGILNIYFPTITAENLMQALPDVAISAGSACLAKGIELSYVLRAMGQSTEQAHHAIRFSFGRFTTIEEIDFVAQRIVDLCKQ